MMHLRGMGISYNPLNWISSEGRVTGGRKCPAGYEAVPADASPNTKLCPSGIQPMFSSDGGCFTCGNVKSAVNTGVARGVPPTPPMSTSPTNTNAAWRGCPPGSVWNVRTGSCLPSSANAELQTHPPIAPLNACPSGWTAIAPGSTPPACTGQPQSFNLPLPDETVVTCTRCLAVSPAAPFVCPSGWYTTQVPCAPGEQPLELLHRNPDGTLAACYQCLQTPASVMYAARAAQAAMMPPAPPPGATPDGGQPGAAPGGGPGFWSNLSTGGKVAVVGAGVAAIALIMKSKGGGRRSLGGGGGGSFRPKKIKTTRRTSDDEDDE